MLILMRMDKRRAQKGANRIREKTLWKGSFLGGGLGAFVGMKTYRHKTKHKSFSWGLPILTIFQLMLFSFLFILLS
ncbi:DUF1294 domain-containing protein [Bacillus spongiae]|uniref:DUF1294 domain-containing protein n=1 Tax=Bacillus spongiae TaxID=2683610 RepID=A0ABU8H8D9_9BACI